MEILNRPSPQAEETERVRNLVGAHRLPDFIEDFEVQLGCFQGEPATWITFRLAGSDDVGLEELEKRADALLPLQEQLFNELTSAGSDRFPFFRVSYRNVP